MSYARIAHGRERFGLRRPLHSPLSVFFLFRSIRYRGWNFTSGKMDFPRIFTWSLLHGFCCASGQPASRAFLSNETFYIRALAAIAVRRGGFFVLLKSLRCRLASLAPSRRIVKLCETICHGRNSGIAVPRTYFVTLYYFYDNR